MAIVHLTDARQRAPLAEQLASQEASGGCGPLPVLVLSPGGRLRLPERTMAGRRGRCLPNTVTVARLLQTCREVVAFNPHGAAAPARGVPSAA